MDTSIQCQDGEVVGRKACTKKGGAYSVYKWEELTLCMWEELTLLNGRSLLYKLGTCNCAFTVPQYGSILRDGISDGNKCSLTANENDMGAGVDHSVTIQDGCTRGERGGGRRREEEEEEEGGGGGGRRRRREEEEEGGGGGGRRRRREEEEEGGGGGGGG